MAQKQYELFEFQFTAPSPVGDQVDIDLSALITSPSLRTVSVKGFYAGENRYLLRFLPEETGTYRYEISSEALSIHETGTAEIEPADAGRHGPVRPDGTCMRYADGTWFASFGTTVYAMMHQSDALIQETLDTLSTSPFNKLRTCVFPKHYAYNANNPKFYPFEKKKDAAEKSFSAEGLPVNPTRHPEDDYWDTTHPYFAFYDHLEGILKQLDQMGIQVDLILFHPYDRWGFSALSRSDSLRYLDYLIRRLAAFPNVWWSLANEYDLCFSKNDEDFIAFETFVAEHDPFHHPLSNHNCFKMWDAGRKNITHVSWQTKELTRTAEMFRTYGKPVMIDECRYEGSVPEFWGNLSGEDMTRSFWCVMAQGGYCTHGETFLPDSDMGRIATDTGEADVVWWAKGGKLNGTSVPRIRFLRQVIEQLPGPLSPCDDGLEILGTMDDEQMSEFIARVPEEFQVFLKRIGRMSQTERARFYSVEYSFKGHCGELAYLLYLNDQCPAAVDLSLPKQFTYQIRLLDTWEMKQTVIMTGASGDVHIQLPERRRYQAILALKE